MTQKSLSRRRFLADSTKLIVVVTSFSVIPCACSNEQSTGGKKIRTTLDIRDGKIVLDINKSPYRTLKNIGSGVNLDIEAEPKPLIVTRVSYAEVAAFSSQCPHAGYQVLLPDNGVLLCESGHGGKFDIRGNVTHGPPKSNLEKFTARLDGNEIHITYPA